MDARLIAIAEECLTAAYDKTVDFPQIVEILIKSGFEGYAVDYRCGTTIYYLPDGSSVVLDNRPTAGTVDLSFDQTGIAAQVEWAQSNSPDYSYEAFCRNVKTLGCAGYIVSFPGRRVLYFGRTAETHVEYFPQ